MVKLGVHKQTGEKYAIKVVNKKKASMNQGKRSRLMDEVAILMKVCHIQSHHKSKCLSKKKNASGGSSKYHWDQASV